MRLALILLLFGTSANAQEASCPQTIEGTKKAALMAGAIRVGTAEDRVELAGGDRRETVDGYQVVYRFPGHELKWLVCFYGKDGDTQRFLRMNERATTCSLQVRESKRNVAVRMTCK